MTLATIDFLVIAAYVAMTLAVGLYFVLGFMTKFVAGLFLGFLTSASAFSAPFTILPAPPPGFTKIWSWFPNDSYLLDAIAYIEAHRDQLSADL